MNPTWVKAVFLVCVFGAVLLGVEALVSFFVSRRTDSRAINARLRMIDNGRSRGETRTILRRGTGSFAASLPPSLAGIGGKLERLVIATQMNIAPARVLLILTLLPVVLFLALLLLMVGKGIAISPGRLLLVVTMSALIGGFVPLMFLQAKANRVRRRMQEQFPVALDVFVRGLRAGHPVASALDLLTVEMADPIGSEFGLVVDEVTYGADLRDAIASMADRWGMEDMRMFVVSLAVQGETGGNLAEILENLSKVIRERASMMMKVRALSSEGRMSAIMLTALPIIVFVSLFLLNPSFYLDVAGDPAFTLGFGGLIVLYLIGFFTIRKMVDLKV